MSDRMFIETLRFPIRTVNEASAKEKRGRGGPPYWEMVFWPTRKPLVGARAIIAGSLLPEDYNESSFLKDLKLDSHRSPNRLNPELPAEVKEEFRRKRLLDPFAGFGSIPLEAIRLGIGEVVAVEFLPTAYIFLKAILEYPKKYGRELKADVEKWGEWVTKRLREDPSIRELYDEDIAVYIGTWEVKCPVCGEYTPLVGKWWLANVKGKRYAYMRPKKRGGQILIEIVEGKTDKVPSPNVGGKPELAECLLCGSKITYIDPDTNRAYRSKREIKDKSIRRRLEFYPKYAIKEWNEKLEEYLVGKIGLEALKDSKARPRLLAKVKVVNGDLKFEPCSEKDNEKIWRALEDLRNEWGDPDIPTELIPPYQLEPPANFPILLYGFDKWFKLYNPRQLLTLIRLVRLIREAGKRIEREKLKEGWSNDEAFRYAEAVTTYLAMALCKYADFNSVATRWNSGWLKFEESLSTRGITMMWSSSDSSPFALFTGTWTRNLKSIINALSYLTSAISDSPSQIRVLLDDATVLTKLDDKRFDVIITDPPYRHDISYTELSDFYYVWLKRALSDEHLRLRFYGDILIYGNQWENLALNEISYHRKRLEYLGVERAEDYYERLMGMAFKRMVELLEDNGLLVTYFAHSSPEAWIELIEAGWRRANLRATKAWAVVTESAKRVTARGKTALESSIAVVWRKREKERAERMGEYRGVYEEALDKARAEKDSALKAGLTDADLFIAVMIGALSVYTSYDRIVRFGRELTSRDVVKDSYAIATRVVSRASESVKSPEALFYLASKSIYRLYSRPSGQTSLEALAGINAEPIVLSSQDIIVLSYGFLREEKEGYKAFVDSYIVGEIGETRGARVAKEKAFILLEPLKSDLEGVKVVLGRRGVNPIKLAAENRPLNTIDVLHLLEYYALQGRGEFTAIYQRLYSERPELVREAVEVARILKGFESDPEKDLAERVVSYVTGG